MTDEQVAAALMQVSQMTVALDAVPTPPALQLQIKTVRDYLSTARRHLNKMRQQHRVLSAELSTMESEYELDFIELIATDDEVKAGGSVTDRKALAKWKLKDQVKAIEGKKIEVAGYEASEKMVWETIKDLEGTSIDISRQMKLLRLDEALGGVSEGKEGETDGDGDLPNDDEDMLDALLTYDEPEAVEDPEAETGLTPEDVKAALEMIERSPLRGDCISFLTGDDPGLDALLPGKVPFGKIAVIENGNLTYHEPEAVEDPEPDPEAVVNPEPEAEAVKDPESEPEAVKDPESDPGAVEDPDDEWADLIDGVEEVDPEAPKVLTAAQMALKAIVVTRPKDSSPPPPVDDDDFDDLLDVEI